ncbi:hypothetical protein GCM10027423_63740 [Spirosoma arcticum]
MPAGAVRGGHRHPAGQMVLQCVVGGVSVYVQIPHRDAWFRLDCREQYLVLEAQDWRLMYDFSADARLVVLAQQPYAPTDYVTSAYRPLPKLAGSLQPYAGCPPR